MKPPTIQHLDQRFLDWVKTLPSCLSGLFSEWSDGRGYCVAAHVRRSHNSGTSMKPLFSAVPLRWDEHECQHRQGEAEALKRYGPMSVTDPTPQEGKDWFDVRALEYRERWISMQPPAMQEMVREAL